MRYDILVTIIPCFIGYLIINTCGVLDTINNLFTSNLNNIVTRVLHNKVFTGWWWW